MLMGNHLKEYVTTFLIVYERLCDYYGNTYMAPVRDTRNQSVHDIVRGDVNL